MSKFRKRPITIEAVQFNGRNGQKILEWADAESVSWNRNMETSHLIIHTLEGSMEAIPSDWIIRGINGELYPCKNDIFRATYDLIVE